MGRSSSSPRNFRPLRKPQTSDRKIGFPSPDLSDCNSIAEFRVHGFEKSALWDVLRQARGISGPYGNPKLPIGKSDFRVPIYRIATVLPNSEYTALRNPPYGTFFVKPAEFQALTETPNFRSENRISESRFIGLQQYCRIPSTRL